MNTKLFQKAKILTAVMVMVSSLLPAVSHASFFDWLGDNGSDPLNYSQAIISHGSLIYATAGLGQDSSEADSSIPATIQDNSFVAPSSLLTVAVAKKA